MKLTKVIVVDKNKNQIIGLMATCDHCDWKQFHVIMIGDHQHLQCTFCEKVYCGGGPDCQAATATIKKPKR